MAEDWLADVRKYVSNADEAAVAGIVRYCGIALRNRDSSLVGFSDSKETDRVRENFLKKKLALTDPDSALDSAIAAVGEIMKADRTKNRVTVYYLLAEKFGKLGLFGGSASASAGSASSSSAVPLAAAAGVAGVAGASATSSAPAASTPFTASPAPADTGTTSTGSAAPLAAAAGLAGVTGAAATGATSATPPPAPRAEPAAVRETAPVGLASAGNDDASGGGGFGRWWPWLLLALALLALFFFLRSCSGTQSDTTATPATESPPAATATAGDVNAVDAAATADTTAAIPQGAGVVTGTRDSRPTLTVYFDSGKSDVSNDLSTAAASVKDYLTKNAGTTVAVSGYNDPTGNAALNAELSKKRAQGVAKALEAAGIPAASIALEKPAATTDAATDKAQARRVEVTVKQ